MRKLIVILALAASPTFAEDSPLPDDFNGILANTCMKYFYIKDTLRNEMGRRGLEELPPEQSGFFLGGQPGIAWIVTAPSTRYVVSLRNDSVCSVFAQQGDQAQIQSGFISLVATAPSPLQASQASSEGIGPNSKHTTTIAYTWSRTADGSELLFVLTTSTSKDAIAQAMATMSLVKKAN